MVNPALQTYYKDRKYAGHEIRMRYNAITGLISISISRPY